MNIQTPRYFHVADPRAQLKQVGTREMFSTWLQLKVMYQQIFF